ncbi:MAG: glycoside hydrolase family 9 protein, partial [Chitinivibrionales bacterium]
MKRTMTLMLVLSCWLSANAVLSLEEVRTASDNVIVVFFKNEGENAEVDDVDVTDPSQWTVNGSPAEAVNIYVMPQSGFNNHVYLTVAELVDGTEYEISTPHGDTTFTFDERETFCEAIKTNQGAYSELASTNYALFSIWLGDGGAKEISGSLPEYEVFEVYTGDQVAQGSIEEIGEDQTSGDFVYRIDLSDVPEGGPYKISVNGCGASHPFGVGGAFSRKLGYTLFRGQYFQRCGVPLRTPYAEHDIRMNPCHTTVYEVNGEIGEANVEVSGDEPTFECYGGYHDAGDADRRAYHMANPIVNLAVYETFPDLFVDEQYNIPTVFDSEYNIEGKGNGVPDIIDEAEWGTLVWEYLQNDDGTIHFGTETDGYPSPFDAPLDEDDKPYGTWVTDDRATATGAGLFMHLARILEPYKPERSQELAERAQLAFNAAGSISDPERLYYYIQKYLYDGDESAHQEIRSLQGAVDDFSNNYMAETGTMGYSLNDDKFDNAAYFISYILESDRETDPEIVERFTSALRTGADNSINDLESYTYPLGTDPGGWGWGQSVRQPRLAFAPILQWGVSEEQEYIDAAAELMNYKLGLNPLGISYVTGVGFHRVHNIHDRESAYTKGMGWG